MLVAGAQTQAQISAYGLDQTQLPVQQPTYPCIVCRQEAVTWADLGSPHCCSGLLPGVRMRRCALLHSQLLSQLQAANPAAVQHFTASTAAAVSSNDEHAARLQSGMHCSTSAPTSVTSWSQTVSAVTHPIVQPACPCSSPVDTLCATRFSRLPSSHQHLHLCAVYARLPLQQHVRGYAKAAGKGGKAAAKPAVAAAAATDDGDSLAPPAFRVKKVPQVYKGDPVAQLTGPQVGEQGSTGRLPRYTPLNRHSPLWGCLCATCRQAHV